MLLEAIKRIHNSDNWRLTSLPTDVEGEPFGKADSPDIFGGALLGKVGRAIDND